MADSSNTRLDARIEAAAKAEYEHWDFSEEAPWEEAAEDQREWHRESAAAMLAAADRLPPFGMLGPQSLLGAPDTSERLKAAARALHNQFCLSKPPCGVPRAVEIHHARLMLAAIDEVERPRFECYLREGEPAADHNLSEGVVCARCYAALSDDRDAVAERLRADRERDQMPSDWPS